MNTDLKIPTDSKAQIVESKLEENKAYFNRNQAFNMLTKFEIDGNSIARLYRN